MLIFRVAQMLGIPFILNVHDDLAYTLKGYFRRNQSLKAIGEVWKNAKACFVISKQLGEEYSRRYGRREFIVVTDGLQKLAPVRIPKADSYRIYFAGMFHHSYTPNLLALIQSLNEISAGNPKVKATFVFRGGRLPNEFNGISNITCLPFGNENEIKADLDSSDFLYLPLPFGVRHKEFIQLSLPTKLVTYLGSGLPIIYHGPSDSAAGKLIKSSDAALRLTNLDVKSICHELLQKTGDRSVLESYVKNAQLIASERFMLNDQKRHFWQTILKMLDRI